MKQKIESIFRHVIAAILAVEIEALMNKFGISLDYNGLGLCINYQGELPRAKASWLLAGLSPR